MGVEDPNGGRPTKLTPELIERAKGYLDTCFDNIETTEKGALAYVDVKLPSVVGLALFLKIAKSSVYEWCVEKEADNETTKKLRQEFSNIVTEVQNEQERRLLENGLGGLYQPKVVGMVLSKHGYSEKIETDVTTKGEKINMGDPELARQFDEFRKKQLKED